MSGAIKEQLGVPLTRTKFCTLLSALVLPVGAFALVVLVTLQARALRPIQDDYDMALYALEGPVGGTFLRWSDWSGDLWTNLMNVVFVGLPIVHFPLDLGSVVAFAATAVVAAVTAAVLIARIGEGSFGIWVLGFIPVLLVAWWAYWWTNSEYDWHPYAESDALTTTFWQNVNATYIIAPLALVLAGVLVVTRSSRDKIYVALIILLGVLAGLTGLVFATAVMICLLVFLVGAWLLRKESVTVGTSRVSAAIVVTGLTAIATGVLLSMASPGSRSRSETFDIPQLSIGNLQNHLWWVADTAVSWIVALASPGALVAAALSCTFVALAKPYLPSLQVSQVLRAGFALLVLSFLIAMTNAVVEFVVYKGYWHLHTSKSLGWVAVVIFGASVGMQMSKWRSGNLQSVVLVFSGVVILLVAAASLFGMTERILLRLPVWEVGPAPEMSINDIENPDVRPLAKRLWLEIGGPSRGLDRD